jgi:two-component system NtrC family sensor kinase
VPGKAVGLAAVDLPWLCPNTDSLIALADAPASLSDASVGDPALAVFILRFASPASAPDPFGLAPGTLHSAALPEMAAAFLAITKSGVLPLSSFALGRVRRVADRAAEIASALADETRLIPARAAAMLTRIAPLGWYAIAAVDPFDAADPFADPRFLEQPSAVQQEVWGLDQAAIARRLVARWRLPAWAATTIGNLKLPLRVAGNMVADRDLFAIVQLAILEAEIECGPLGLANGANRAELLEHLRIDESTVKRLCDVKCKPVALSESGLDANPHRVPLVRNLLRLAGESRRRNGPGLVVRLEEQIDGLHRLVADLGDQAGIRLRDAKLAGLAELAAGAGHEINNPLAIISGNAQRLSRTEADVQRGESLHAIVRQANRIAALLRDLMQFARPPQPRPTGFPVSELVEIVCNDLLPLATELGVRLELQDAPRDQWINGDKDQLRHALGAVVRNGIEAAGADGWVRLTCSTNDGALAIACEDSGPGLTAEAIEHAFDPFYCGRAAGRGRGLGLSTAWQLVRQNGGDLSFSPTSDCPTRFILKPRRSAGYDHISLRSA